MRWLLAIVACAGCSSILGIDDFKLSDGGTVDMGDGSSTDAPANCVGADRFIVCLDPPPTSEVAFTTSAMAAVDTDTDSRCLAQQPQGWMMQGQDPACFIVGTRITIGVPLVARGSRPLVLAADDAIVIGTNGSVDAAARRTIGVPPQRAPGAPSSACVAPSPAQDSPTMSGAGGGGAGGTFMTAGGRGGPSPQAPGGNPSAPGAAPSILRAGCNGGIGGRGGGTTQFAASGNAGGAVFLVARNRIDIDGPINASGSGADGGGSLGGGGGAGSGGMIVLHAAQLNAMSRGTLVANGGGGGAGADGAGNASPGADPNPTAPTQPAAGGSGPSPGGPGFPASASDGVQGGNQRGGGGGGGGGGYIRVNQMINIPASPAVSVVQ